MSKASSSSFRQRSWGECPRDLGAEPGLDRTIRRVRVRKAANPAAAAALAEARRRRAL